MIGSLPLFRHARTFAVLGDAEDLALGRQVSALGVAET
jgi:hypothetical protein